VADELDEIPEDLRVPKDPSRLLVCTTCGGSGRLSENDKSVRCVMCGAYIGDIRVEGRNATEVNKVLKQLIKARPETIRARKKRGAIALGAAAVVLSGMFINLLTNGGYDGMMREPLHAGTLLVLAIAAAAAATVLSTR
jgi:hypothetical protein